MRMLSVLLAIAFAASLGLASQAMAQAQMPAADKKPAAAGEQKVTGEIKSIDKAAGELTLKDGTKLAFADKAKMAALKEGATVMASYKEEAGRKVVTSIDVQPPAASPPTAPATTPAPEKKQ